MLNKTLCHIMGYTKIQTFADYHGMEFAKTFVRIKSIADCILWFHIIVNSLPRTSIRLSIHKVILGTWWTPKNSVASSVVKFLSFFLAIISLVLTVVYCEPLSARQMNVP